MRPVAAVILAAGGSSRLGRPKQLLNYDGQPLIVRAVDIALAAGCAPVVAVVGRDADDCAAALKDRSVVIVHNADWQQGMGSSIRVGVRAVRSLAPSSIGSLLLMLVDQPNVTADVLHRLITLHDTSDRPVAVSEYANTVGPPVIAGGDFVRQLADWPDDRGAKELWLRDPDAVVRMQCPEAVTDIDTEADYLALTHSSRRAADDSKGPSC